MYQFVSKNIKQESREKSPSEGKGATIREEDPVRIEIPGYRAFSPDENRQGLLGEGPVFFQKMHLILKTPEESGAETKMFEDQFLGQSRGLSQEIPAGQKSPPALYRWPLG